MLEYLRQASDKPLAKILVVILIFSFVGWGVASWILGGNRMDDSILRVGGAPLKIQSFDAERGRIINAMSRDEQKKIYSDKAAQKVFSEQILSRMTTELMLQQRAIDLDFTVSDSYVAMILRMEPVFQTNGKFDLGRYNAILSQSQITEEQLSNSIRNEILRRMVLSGVNTGVKAPKFMTDVMYQSRYIKREIEFATVKFSDFKISENPTEQQLRETYAKNPKIIPESRKVSYVLIPAKMSQPDSYDAGYKTAQKLEDDLIGGESMAKAAAKVKAKFVSLPEISMGQKSLDPIIVDINIFAMEQGIESEIIETKSGFVIVRVDNITAQHNAPFESVKKDLVSKWRIEQQEKMAYKKANELLIKLKDEKKLIGGKTAVIGRANGAPVEVLNFAFANNIGTKTIVPATNAFYVLNIKKEIPADINKEKQTAIAKESDILINRAIVDDYMSFLQRKYKVKINERVYKRLIN